MRRGILFDFINKHITEKIYKQAREREKELLSDNFTAYYLSGSVIYWLVFCLFFIFCTFTFGFFDKVILYILIAASIGSILILLYHISYRCIVDDTGIKVKNFGFLKSKFCGKMLRMWKFKNMNPMENH